MAGERIINIIRGAEDVLLGMQYRLMGMRRERIGNKVVYTVKREADGPLHAKTIENSQEGVLFPQEGRETLYYDESGNLVRTEVNIRR